MVDISLVYEYAHAIIIKAAEDFREEMDKALADAGPSQDQKRALYNMITKLPGQAYIQGRQQFEQQFGAPEWTRQEELAMRRQTKLAQ